MEAIERCRTAALGGHLEVCSACGHESPAYNSCRNRHCPKCQGLRQLRWLEQRKARLLPTHYFHVVFTLPRELHPLALRNRRLVFGLLFAAAAQSLLALGQDSKHVGGQLGISAVLHTWSRQLLFHPHIHCIVTGGGLSADGQQWHRARKDYLFPVRALGALFRGKLLAALDRARRDGQLRLPAVDNDFDALLSALYRKHWVVYCKRPFGGPEQVYRYLGRYTHRVALSNHRLVAVTDEQICFKTRDGATTSCSPEQFIGRFLLHILPPHFVRIRHFGLLASGNVTTKLARARRLLAQAAPATLSCDAPTTDAARLDWQSLLLLHYGLDLATCPRCGSRARRRVALRPSRAPPSATTPVAA